MRALVAQGSPIVCDVRSLCDPDIGTVDALARLHLTVTRMGGSIVFRGAGDDLNALVELVGLKEVLRLEPVGQPEEREQALGVEEEADPRDLAFGDRQDL